MTERSCLPSQARTHTNKKAQAKTRKRHIKTYKHVTPSQAIINPHYIQVYWRWYPCWFFLTVVILILNMDNKNEMISVQFTRLKFLMLLLRTEKVLMVWWIGNTKKKQLQIWETVSQPAYQTSAAEMLCQKRVMEMKKILLCVVDLADFIGLRTGMCRSVFKIHQHFLEKREDVHSCLSTSDCWEGPQHPHHPG